MSNAAKKIQPQYAPGERECLDVAAAVSPDETREHLCKPFGREMKGAGWICGTDGHRLHAVRCEAWQSFQRPTAPPAEQVIPWEGKWRGEIVVGGLEAARHFSSRWDVKLSVAPQALRATVSVRTGSGKKSSVVHPFGRDGVPVDWFRPLEQLTYAFGIYLPYLLDAVDFVGTNVVSVWSEHSAKYQDLEPLAFTAPGVKSLADAHRTASRW